MADILQLNTSWLAELTNPHHDGTSQQIDDFVQAFTTDNARFLQKAAALHQARQAEDEVWLKSQRDPAAKQLEAADKQQDAYVTAARYINLGHASLPDDEPTKAEAVECEQVFKDYRFQTRDAYGAESDKIIQMQQNFAAHVTHLTQIGAWPIYLKAVEAAQLVRQLLGQRALTLGEAVRGEMKAARKATDAAIADLYVTIEAMMDLMPSAELTTLYNQLKGIELYARQYYLNGKGSGSGVNNGDSDDNGGSGSSEQGGSSSEQGSGSTEQGGSSSEQGSGSSEQGGSTEQGGGSGDNGSGSGDNGGGSDNNGGGGGPNGGGNDVN